MSPLALLLVPLTAILVHWTKAPAPTAPAPLDRCAALTAAVLKDFTESTHDVDVSEACALPGDHQELCTELQAAGCL